MRYFFKWSNRSVKVESYYSGLSTSMVIIEYGTPVSSMETLSRTGEVDSRTFPLIILNHQHAAPTGISRFLWRL